MTQEVDELYKETLDQLKGINVECKKSSDVNLHWMLESSRQCQEKVARLQTLDIHQVRNDALSQLQQMLTSQQQIISAKIADLQRVFTQEETPAAVTTGPAGDGSAAGDSRFQAISNTIVPKTGVRFEDVAGLTEAKQALKEAIIMPLQFPQLFHGCCKPWQRILLYGPPGTGKSRLAQAVAAEIQSTFYSVSSSDLLSSWVGESEKLIKELFQHALHQGNRSVIFIDEIDGICRQRHSGEQEYTRRIKTELLKQMEGVNADSRQDQIFILCATNCPWDLDTAFLRRFQKRIFTPLPDKAARLSLLQNHTKNHPLNITAAQWNVVAEATQGFSGSDLATLVTSALYEPIREMQTANYWQLCSDGKFRICDHTATGAFRNCLSSLPSDKVASRELTHQDFLRSLKNTKKTVLPADLQKFEDFANSFSAP